MKSTTLSGIVLCKPQDVPPNLGQILRDEIPGKTASPLLDTKAHRLRKTMHPFHNSNSARM